MAQRIADTQRMIDDMHELERRYPPAPAITPKHAVSLQPGDIVKLTPEDRRRVVQVVDTGAAFVTGIWEILTGPTPSQEPFSAPFCRFFTVEKAG